MHKSQRQGRQPAKLTALPETGREDGKVINLNEAPPMAPSALTHGEVRAILGSLMLCMFLAALDQTIVATALPTIGREFQDVSNLSWVITAYLLASTAVAPVFGTLSNIYGRRAMIIVALSLFMVGSLLCALARNMPMLILARGLQGLGGGGIIPVVQTVMSDLLTPRERGQYQAYMSAVWVGAGIGGPVLGGIFAEHLHWSMIFWINLPLGLGALALLVPKMAKIPTFHRRRKVDWFGGILLMTSAIGFMLVLTWGGDLYPWLSPTIAAMIGSAVALALAFVWHARRTKEPFIPLPLIGGRVVPYAISAGSFSMSALIGLTVQMPLYYQVVYHFSASEAGLALIPLVAMAVPGAALAGRTMAHVKHYSYLGIAGTTCGAIVALTLALVTPLPLWALLTLLSIMAFGLGTSFPICVVSTQNAVARSQVGTVTGAFNFFRSLLVSFTVAAMTAILLMALGNGLSIGEGHRGSLNALADRDMIEAFRYVFAAAAVLLVGSALCLTGMEERSLDGPAATTQMTE